MKENKDKASKDNPDGVARAGEADDCSEKDERKFSLANNVLLSVMLTALLSVLLIVGYSHMSKMPNPMSSMLAKQEILADRQEATIEQIKQTELVLGRSIESLTDRVLQAMQDSDSGCTTVAGETLRAKQNEKNIVVTGDITEMLAITKQMDCVYNLTCVSDEYPNLKKYTAQQLSVSEFVADLLNFAEKDSGASNGGLLSKFMVIKRFDRNIVDGVLNIMRTNAVTDDHALSQLGLPVEFIERARAINEKQLFFSDMHAKIKAQMLSDKLS